MDESIKEYNPQFEIFLANKLRTLTLAPSKFDRTLAATTHASAGGNSPAYWTSNSVYGSQRSTTTLYGLNYSASTGSTGGLMQMLE